MWFWKYVDINIYVPLTFSYHMSTAEHVPDQLYQINHESTGVKSPYSCAQRRLYTITTRLFCALMSTIISSAYSVDCTPTQASEGQCHVILMENTINKSQADLGNLGGGDFMPPARQKIVLFHSASLNRYLPYLSHRLCGGFTYIWRLENDQTCTSCGIAVFFTQEFDDHMGGEEKSGRRKA